MTVSSWKVALAGETEAIAKAVAARAPDRAPDKLALDYKPAKTGADWLARMLAAPQGSARWEGSAFSLAVRRGVIVEAEAADVAPTAQAALTWLADLPFEVASFATLHPSWLAGPTPYDAPTFADGHWPHGWACAFRGPGHEHLVSRRWLEHGPWALVRGGNDLSLVLFHDPAADADTALAQARPGHARMGIAPDGGYIQRDFVYKYDLHGRYLPATREMRIMATRRDVEPREMLEACASRWNARWGLETNVDLVSYVFLEEDRARRHLHELWLRGLGCLAMIEGEEHRLDSEHHPAPAPPAWAAKLIP